MNSFNNIKPESINAILLDMDGTIFDTEAIYRQTWIETAIEFGKPLPKALYESFTGVRADICHQKAHDFFGADFPMDEFIAAKTHNNKIAKKERLGFKAGAQAFIDQCFEQGITLGLVTSTARPEVVSNLTPYGYYERFAVIVTGDDVEHAKPNPECYLKACDQLGLSPQQTLVVEDSIPGCQASITAGCQTVMIPDLIPATNDITQSLIAHIQSFDHLQPLLKKLP